MLSPRWPAAPNGVGVDDDFALPDIDIVAELLEAPGGPRFPLDAPRPGPHLRPPGRYPRSGRRGLIYCTCQRPSARRREDGTGEQGRSLSAIQSVSDQALGLAGVRPERKFTEHLIWLTWLSVSAPNITVPVLSRSLMCRVEVPVTRHLPQRSHRAAFPQWALVEGQTRSRVGAWQPMYLQPVGSPLQ